MIPKKIYKNLSQNIVMDLSNVMLVVVLTSLLSTDCSLKCFGYFLYFIYG